MAQITPFPSAPAPWKLRSESYLLMVRLPKTLPDGIYDPLEASSEAFSDPARSGKHRGGLGAILIVRYTETPVGPYDELMIVPGSYQVPGHGSKRRIARIYVNQKETTYNGRTNWNIPKHLARFAFSAPATKTGSKPPESLHVAVFPPSESATESFFSVTLKPFRRFPAVPFSSRYLPVSISLTQPPIPSGEADYLVGTDTWAEYGIGSSTGRTRGAWVEVHPPADDQANREATKWWPTSVKPVAFGVWMENVTVDIGEATRWKP
ncbi:hypothetical protein P152DRAFT_462832 [Eremomyces bilateralis CBS 781.70]|uniref:Uncharacterized protein n=1 Tax=Eremomyces bilateralis CBS 781.70 TaxID=1392243 RepID=A0A6G1FR22_9PEZI|nr:uncharacterized protein P152DRAFT_462832 [Eremomyces bilateralis CBS 781.70]KAF1808178.1 hypothetical protein P152DRAFT_462832 [Eremomyces bilateralis CBS 781.70]